MSGRKIIESLKEAVAGNFSTVTINGQTWVRKDDAGISVTVTGDRPISAEEYKALSDLFAALPERNWLPPEGRFTGWSIHISPSRPWNVTINKPDGGEIRIQPEGHVTAGEAEEICKRIVKALVVE